MTATNHRGSQIPLAPRDFVSARPRRFGKTLPMNVRSQINLVGCFLDFGPRSMPSLSAFGYSPSSDNLAANIAAGAPNSAGAIFGRFARTASLLGLLESRIFARKRSRPSGVANRDRPPYGRITAVCARGSGRGQAWHSGTAKSRSIAMVGHGGSPRE
jgi:hypothetical protein